MVSVTFRCPPSDRRAQCWRVFLTCWLVYSVFWTPYIVREHFPAIALAERGTLNVERYVGWTDDIFVGPQGGAYINNNPGASVTGAIPLILLKPLLARVDKWNQALPRPSQRINDGEMFWRTLREGRAFYFLLVAFLTVALVMAPLTAATAAFLCSRLIESGIAASGAAISALLYGVGTPVLFRAAHLNHNLLVSDAGFTALLLIYDPKNAPIRSMRAAMAGLLAGYAILCDYSGIVVIIVTAGYVWLRSSGQPIRARLRVMAAYAGGLAPLVLALALYQAWAFGSLYRPSAALHDPHRTHIAGISGIRLALVVSRMGQLFRSQVRTVRLLPRACPGASVAHPANPRALSCPVARNVGVARILCAICSVLRGEPILLASAADGLPLPCPCGAGAGDSRYSSGPNSAARNPLDCGHYRPCPKPDFSRCPRKRYKASHRYDPAPPLRPPLDDPASRGRMACNLGADPKYVCSAGTGVSGDLGRPLDDAG